MSQSPMEICAWAVVFHHRNDPSYLVGPFGSTAEAGEYVKKFASYHGGRPTIVPIQAGYKSEL